LQECYCAIISDAPRTTAKAYQAAQHALKNNEDLTFNPGEIDLMLPSKLRDTKGGSSENE
jgi:hypothetical protein